ncbi:MAG TPA: hypothetical protein VHK01_12470 [Lacipirellulaceae bacterium]|nr:hypothetical protein [Lacipirellulaceae bacterium]
MQIGHGLTSNWIVAAIAVCASVWLFPSAANAQEDIDSLLEKAREDFRPVTDDQLAGARADVLKRMDELERFVGRRTANGQRWQRYLRWDALRSAMSSEGSPSLEPLDATLERLNRDENGLELPQFRRLADALELYRNFVAVSQWDNPEELYGQQLDALNSDIERYREDATAANEARLAERLGIIADLGQAPELVAAVRREFARPNAFIDIATPLIAAGAKPVNRMEPVTDNILGTRIHGDAFTTGTVEVASIASDDKAVLQFRSRGRVDSQNVGYNGPAVIRSTSHTNYTATKRVELSDRAFASHPASASATTDTDIHSIAKRGGGLGSRIVSSQGWRRARENEWQAEAIAADHAEDRIERRFNQDVNQELREAREQYEKEYRDPLARRGAFPEHIRFSSDVDSLAVEATQASKGQLAAASDPPAAPEGHEMTMRLHESAVNNYSAVVLGGATASETRPGEEAKFNVNLPEWMKNAWEQRKTDSEESPSNDEQFKEWSMTFRDRPLSVNFKDAKVKITIHVARLQSGDRTFEDWDISGTYTPELAGGGVVLRREGDLVMLPADFDGTLSSRQTAERRNLEEELNERSAQGRGFPITIEFEPIEPEGALADAGPLELNEFKSEDGWLSLAWDRGRR